MERNENLNENSNENSEQAEDKVTIRHTITADEAFTLAKDVYDIRSFIVNVYENRAVIARRLNVLTLTLSAIFTVLYLAYVLVTALAQKLELAFEIVLYVLLGVYFALFVALIISYSVSKRAKTKNLHTTKSVLAVFKILVRLASIAISIVAIVFSNFQSDTAGGIALKILIIVFSIIMLIVQIIPLLFGGTAKTVRWLLSPVNKKYRFSAVILEWYSLAVSGTATGTVKKVASRYFEDIGTLIDNYLIPALGKKYITSIKPVNLINAVEGAEEKDKPVLEGVLKNVFAYAAERGYVTFDPCKDLNFQGSVEEEEKPPRETFKGKMLKLGGKIGKSVLSKYISKSTEGNKK